MITPGSCITEMIVPDRERTTTNYGRLSLCGKEGAGIEEELVALLPADREGLLSELRSRYGSSREHEICRAVWRCPSAMFSSVSTGETAILVPAGREAAILDAMNWVEAESLANGGLSLADVVRHLDLKFGWFTDIYRIKALVERIYDIVWLDESFLWFWVNDSESPFVRQVLAAICRARAVTAAELKRELEEWHRVHVMDIPMPHSERMLLNLCRALSGYCFVDEYLILAGDHYRPEKADNPQALQAK